MFSIFGRYLLRETLINWLGVTSVLLLILMSSRFARFLGDAASGELPGSAVFSLLGLAMVNYLTVLIPVGLLFAIMLSLGRLYRDSEMAAYMACGGGPGKLYRAYAWFAGVLVILLAVLSLFVSPWAARQSALVRAGAEHDANYSLFEAGRFTGTDNGNQVFYAREVSNTGQLRDVFVHSYEEQGQTSVVRATRGSQREAEETGYRTLVLHDGYRYQGAPGKAAYDIIAFAEHGIHLKPTAADISLAKQELWPTTKLLHADNPAAIAELQWRLSTPIMV
ncbi:MAG TPA: LPS export ABC transporter permease LptF, partial [Gammaproteobacteria bacterium]|nr:LPS export ABC transporter permease LptF [Gammaproteobacteria bacterium]